MAETNTSTTSEKMYAPSYKLLVATPMAAIMSSGKNSSEWSAMLQSIAPIYAAAAAETTGEVNEVLSAVAAILRDGDASIRKYFDNESLSFDKLMEISATGADIWMCRLSDGEIEKPELIKLFKAIQDGLIEATGDLRSMNEMVDQFIQIQGKIIDHISSLN